MKKLGFIISLIALALVATASIADARCTTQRVMSVNMLQAKFNCEAIMGGEAHSCKYGAPKLWYCSCNVGCSDNPRVERVMGSGMLQAQTNCELIRGGQASRCQYAGNKLWYCDCHL